LPQVPTIDQSPGRNLFFCDNFKIQFSISFFTHGATHAAFQIASRRVVFLEWFETHFQSEWKRFNEEKLNPKHTKQTETACKGEEVNHIP